MSNASLKEQLQALSLGSSETPSATHQKDNTRTKHQPRPIKNTAKQSKQKPAWLEYAQYGVELLKAHFPNCFRENKDLLPLKVGIKQDLVKLLSSRDDITINDKACMVNSLSYYVNSAGYHKNMVEGAQRIDLDGNPAGAVSAEEALYSVECRKAKLEKKKPSYQSQKPVEKA